MASIGCLLGELMMDWFIAGLMWGLSVYFFRYAFKSGKKKLEFEEGLKKILDEGGK